MPVALSLIVATVPDEVDQTGLAFTLKASDKVPDNPEGFVTLTSKGSFAFDTDVCTLAVICVVESTATDGEL